MSDLSSVEQTGAEALGGVDNFRMFSCMGFALRTVSSIVRF
jgi:hypothetical protein